MRSYVALCDGIVGLCALYGVTGRYVGLCGVVWRCVTLLWCYVALHGAVRRYVALCGVMWRFVALCGGI